MVGGHQEEYEIVGGIEHVGAFDDGGHYFTIVHHEGQFKVVNQEAKITRSKTELRNCQIYMYQKIPLTRQGDEEMFI